MANDLLTLDDLANFGLDDTDTVQAHLDAAVAIVRSWCRWHVAPARTETLTVDGDDSPQLVLPTLHVTDVDSVTVDGDEVTDFDWSTYGTLDRTTGTWPCGRRNVAVDLTHGHQVDDVADLTAVVAAVAARLPAAVGGADTDPLALAQQLGQLRVGMADGAGGVGLTAAERLMLGAHRLP